MVWHHPGRCNIGWLGDWVDYTKQEEVIFRIPAGKHRARPLRFGLWWNKKDFTWKVHFTNSCRYNLQGEDQRDINKLCGVGYLPGHHTDSARFGWRYLANQDKIELLAYCYVNGHRAIKSIALCRINAFYKVQLLIGKSSYIFMAIDDNGKCIGSSTVKYYHRRKLQYRLGTFFGGNKPAPHNITIELRKM